MDEREDRPQYNPYYSNASAPPPYNPQKESLIKSVNRVDDDEEEMDHGPNVCLHFCTVFGLWILFGGTYWFVITIWGYIQYKFTDLELFYWCFCALGVALICMVIVLVGISKGIELGTLKSVKWVLPYCLMCSVNIWVHIYFSRKTEIYLGYSVAFIACDFLSLFYVSAVCYGFYKKTNRSFRLINFGLEWLDVASQIMVALIYQHLSKSDNANHFENLFWIFILIQLFFWVIPILCGSGTNTKSCLRQIFVLDLCTDLPLLIVNIASGAFLLSTFIFIDLLVKIMFMIRYFWVFFKYFKHSDLKRNPCQIFVFFPFCCDIE